MSKGAYVKEKASELVFDYTKADSANFRDYMIKLMHLIKTKEVEKVLVEKFLRARKEVGIQRKMSDVGVLKPKAFIVPADVEVYTRYGVPVQLKYVNNSAVKLAGGRKLGIFLRLGSIGSYLLGEWKCRTFIAYTEVNYDELEGRLRVKAKPIMVPLNSSDCIEDPRVDPDDSSVVYHVRGYYLFWRSEISERLGGHMAIVLTLKSTLNEENEVIKVEPLAFADKSGEIFLLRDYRDSFPLTESHMTIRPWLVDVDSGGVFVGPREDNVVLFEEMEPVPDLLPQEHEKKTGGNAAVRISSNEYLLFYHAVEKYFGAYYTYAALFSSSGEYLGSTVEPVISVAPDLYPGCRPTTIFVCGAVKVGDKVLVTAGKDDEILVIYEASLEEILEKIKYVK